MRLIDADALKTIRSIQSADYNSIETIQHWIDNAPTIDAVPVIRCRDCAYSETDDNGFYYCVHDIIGGYGMTFCADTFCSYGERKDDE